MDIYGNLKDILMQDAVFSSLPESALDGLAESGCVTEKFGQNETVYSNERFRRAIGLVLAGDASVYRSGGGYRTLLNKLTVGDKFGVASLYSPDKTFVTDVVAGKECEIFFVPADVVDGLIRKYPDFSVAYISFLSDRIRFLNKRIAEFSAPSVESKLAKYLLGCESGSDPPNMVRLASSLGIGRASLYRILDSFTEKGLICRDGKNIVITDKEKLHKLV